MKTKLSKLMCTLFAVMVCMSMNAQATSGSCGDNATWEYDNGTLTITGTGEITTYSTDMPTAYPWYAYAEEIQTVIIGEGITNIPAWAFAMYENLRSIHLPSTLKTIGWSALEETALWNVWLPEGLEKIEGYAFMMTPFSTVSIPSTVTEIGERAFGYCENLVSVGCYAATPPTLGSNAFGDSPVATVYVASAKVVDYQGATGWSDFGDKIQSPAGYCGPNGTDDDGDDDVTQATWSFDMSTRTLTIEGTKMGQYNRPWESAGMGGQGGGFNPDNNVGYPCGIEHVVIGEGIAAIPPMSFYMEVGIKTVTLPSTLTAIGMNAFGECFNIETITCDATTPPSLAAEVDPDWGLANPETYVIFGTLNDETGEPNPIETLTAIYVPAEAVADYKAADGWSTYADNIQAGGAGDLDDCVLADDATDNSAAIAGRNGRVATVTLSGRTLYKDGEWNTICLPFDLVLEDSPLAGATAKTLSDATMTGTTVSLTFGDAETTLRAGVPYIIKWESGEAITDPVFAGVTMVSSTDADRTITKADGHVKFIGYYDAFTIDTPANDDIYYMTTGSTLKHTGKERTLMACRAYFQFSEAAAARQFVLDFGDGTTGIENAEANSSFFILHPSFNDDWYTIDGRKLDDQPTRKGLYIHGNKKVVVK